MSYPKFYDEVKEISLTDPLADILGSLENGQVTFSYLQIVKSAGHSCPTVAGAYLMTYKALDFLFKNETVIRGNIKVEFKENIEDGVAGVIANVISNITGATSITGFKGLNGKFVRHSLMDYNSNIDSSARFTRIDTNKSVDVYYNPSSILADEKMMPLMQKILMGNANDDEKTQFGILWQKRVKEILVDNCDNENVIKLIEI